MFYLIYYDGLQAVVPLVQQWLSTNGKFKNAAESTNTAVVRPTRLDVSGGLQYTLESQRGTL